MGKVAIRFTRQVTRLVPAMLVSVAGLCGTALAEDGKPKVAFLLKTMQEDRYETDKRLFTEAATALGAEVMFNAANNDEERQQDQIADAIAADVDVIVLQPVNTGTAGALVAMANQKGIRVVGYDSMLTNGPLDAMVMQDSWAVGTLQGQAMVAWLKARHGGRVEGNVVLIMGQPGDSNAQAMSSGVLEIIADNPGLILVAQRPHVGWSAEAARETAEALLVKHDNRIDAFICNNSGMAWGVMAALAEQGLDDADKVFVAGSDADLRNIRLVAAGKQSMDVWKDIAPLATKAAEVAVALSAGPDQSVPDLLGDDATMKNNGAVDVPTIVTPVVAVTRDTIDATLVVPGVYTAEQVRPAE